MNALNGVSNGSTSEDRRILSAPVLLSKAAADMEEDDQAIISVWNRERDDSLVCSTRLSMSQIMVLMYIHPISI